MNNTSNQGYIENNVTNKYERELKALKYSYADDIKFNVMGINFQKEVINCSLQNIRFRLNSQIAGLTKSIESVNNVIDSLERQRNYHERQNGSNIAEEQAYNNFQEGLGNSLAEIRQLLTGYEYARDIAVEEKRAKVDFFKMVLKEDYVPFFSNNSKKKFVDNTKRNYQRKLKNIQITKDFWNNEKSGKIPVVINDSEIIPAIIK